MFPLPKDEEVGTDAVVEKSKLLMYVTSASANAPEVNWNIYPSMSTTWKENTIDWANKPTYQLSQLLDSKQCIIPDWNDEMSRTVSFDVGTYVAKQHENGKKAVTFQINQDKRASDGKGNTEFASKEYSKAVEPYVTDKIRFVTCVFGSLQNGKIKVKATEAKMARGEMVRRCAEENVQHIDEVKNFTVNGYSFDGELSGANEFVFLK